MIYNVQLQLTQDQDDLLRMHVRSLTVTDPGTEAGTKIIRDRFTGVPAFLADMFVSSISHLIPMAANSETAELQRKVDEAQKALRDSKVSMVQVAQEAPTA